MLSFHFSLQDPKKNRQNFSLIDKLFSSHNKIILRITKSLLHKKYSKDVVQEILDISSEDETIDDLELTDDNKLSTQERAKWIINSASYKHIPPTSDDDDAIPPLAFLGFALAKRRISKGLSISNLASMSNIDNEVIFLIENGLVPITTVAKNLKNLCHHLGLNYHQFSNALTKLTLKK